MNRKFFTVALLALLALVMGSCGGDDDEEVGLDNPALPFYLQEGNDLRPIWYEPDNSDFEITMAVQVQLGDTLAAFQSQGDLMCAKVNDTVRAVSPLFNTLGISYFSLTIAGNSNDKTVSLHYYCDRLHRIYSITNWTNFNASAPPTGSSRMYHPCFTTEH